MRRVFYGTNHRHSTLVLSRSFRLLLRADPIPEESRTNKFRVGRDGEIAQFFLAL